MLNFYGIFFYTLFLIYLKVLKLEIEIKNTIIHEQVIVMDINCFPLGFSTGAGPHNVNVGLPIILEAITAEMLKIKKMQSNMIKCLLTVYIFS